MKNKESSASGLLISLFVISALLFFISIWRVVAREQIENQFIQNLWHQYQVDRFLFEAELVFRKWEYAAPACVDQGFDPLEPGENRLTLRDPRFTAALARPYEFKEELYIAEKAALAPNQAISVCVSAGIAQGKLSRTEAGNELFRLTLSDLIVPKDLPAGLKDAKGQIVVWAPVEYYSETEHDGSKILYEKTSAGTKPALIGFQNLGFRKVDENSRGYTIELSVKAGTESIRRIEFEKSDLPFKLWFYKNGKVT